MSTKAKRRGNAQSVQRILASGRCRDCGGTREEDRRDRQTCRSCGKKRSEYNARILHEKRREAIAKGWCAVCFDREPVEGRLTCAACAEAQAEITLRHRANNRKRGICTRCSTHLTPEERAQGFSRCAYHRRKSQAYRLATKTRQPSAA
jgi:hypothetical protein